jgi:hypothetical protein
MKTDESDLTDGLDIETGFNDALENLKKSLNRPDKLSKSQDDPEDESYDEDDIEDDDEAEDEDEGMKKSIEDILRQEPEAAAAMDVEPFLLQLAKAIDESMEALTSRMATVEKLTKSIGMTAMASAEFQKSTHNLVKAMGDTPMPVSSIQRLSKSRFEPAEGEPVSYKDILSKSRDWFQNGKIDITESGMIEGRVNKGLVGKVGDNLDRKIVALLKEGTK